MPNKISVLITDDNVEFAQILRKFFDSKSDVEVVGLAQDGEEALELVKQQKPDVLLLDGRINSIMMSIMCGTFLLLWIARSSSIRF